MRVLVAVASKHGATEEIAAAIGRALEGRGHDVVVALAGDVNSLDGYDAAVLGSAVYAGHWLPAALDLVERIREAVAGRPLWLFSSGPVGEPAKPEGEPVDVQGIVEATGARAHRVFAGRLERKRLSFGERALVTALRAPEGDFRDWEEVGAWARAIADELAAGERGSGAR